MVGREKRLGGRVCLVPGCGRKVRPGRAVCPECRRTREGRDAERVLKQLTVDLTRAVEDEETPRMGRLAAEAVIARLATSGDGALLAERLAELTREVQVDQKLSDDLALVRAATLLRLRGEEDPVTLSKRVVQNVNLATKMVQARQALRKERR